MIANINISDRLKKAFRTIIYVYYASKCFPFGDYFFVVFPFISILLTDGLMNSIWDLLLVIPYGISMASGFIHNTICDLATDPKEKNIIGQGHLQKGLAENSMVILMLLAIISSIILYNSWIAIALFWSIILMALAYNGLGMRLKESMFGPIIASITLWIGAPLVILTEFNYIKNSLVLLLVFGIFFVYIGYEIQHTIRDYEIDLAYGNKTFSVRAGKKNAVMVEYLSVFLGYILLISSIYTYSHYIFTNALIFCVIVFALSLGLAIAYGIKVKFNIERNSIFPVIPYHITKLFILFYGLLILKIPEAILVFIIYIHISNIFSVKFLKNFFENYLHDRSPVEITYLKGWFDVERQGDLCCRWIEQFAYLTLIQKDNQQIAVLKFKAKSFNKPKVLNIFSNGHLLQSSLVPTHLTDIAITIELVVGDNLIFFEIPDGSQRPCDINEFNNIDCRYLSIYICGLNVSVPTTLVRENSIFKDGWHELERIDGQYFRWMRKEASIELTSVGGKNYTINFDVMSFYRPRDIIIYLNDQLILQTLVPTEYISLNIKFQTKIGINMLWLKTLDECERPCELPDLNNEDPRVLCIAVKNFKIILN
jgi:4-hydroxybenzoate polyprenyltransferase